MFETDYSKLPLFLKENKSIIDSFLSHYIRAQMKLTEKTWPFVEGLLPHLIQFVERDGKRIRPALALLSYEAFGGKKGKAMLLPAIGTELMHDSFIIHDDLYDDLPGVDGTRRGKQVLHHAIRDDFSSKLAGEDSNWEAVRFADYATIAIAHVLLALGGKTITESEFSPDIKVAAHSLYWATTGETWIGQAMDILSKGKPIFQVSAEEIIMTERSRAGVYTVEFPALLGAVCAGADQLSLDALSIYGRAAGLAFEVYDDILAIFGKEAEIGKMKADLIEGKRTLLFQKALENATPGQRALLLEILTAKDFEHVDQVAKDLLVTTGAFAKW